MQSQLVISSSSQELGLGSAVFVTPAVGRSTSRGIQAREALAGRPNWVDREYRQAYAEAAVEQGTAWQIRANRKARGWSQDELASKLETFQSAVSRLEDPEYGKHSIETLIAVANAFDCALSVRFVSYSALALESLDLSPEAMVVPSYDEEHNHVIEVAHDGLKRIG